MKCERARELFSSYWENTIEPPLRVAFEQHLSQCGQCSAEYDRFHATVVMLDELPAVETPPDFHAAVMARVEQVRRSTPKRVKWWDMDWQKVFTIRVPARAAALGFAVLLIMVLLVKLTPVGVTVANIFGLQRVGTTAITPIPDAPPAPKPASPNREVGYIRPGAGLSISVTPASASDRSSVYVLRLGTDSKVPVRFTITQFDEGNKTYSDNLVNEQAYNYPLTVAPSNGSKKSEAAQVKWQYGDRQYSEYVFVPLDFEQDSSRLKLDEAFNGATLYEALSKISADYGVVILAPGDVVSTGAVEARSADVDTALGSVASGYGLQMRKLAPSIYTVETAQ